MLRQCEKLLRRASLGFGKLINRSTITLQRWARKGLLKARRYYTHEQYLQISNKSSIKRISIAYFRVSSQSQKSDLASQRTALEQFCTARGLSIDEWLSDIGSGLNFKRKNFIKI